MGEQDASDATSTDDADEGAVDDRSSVGGGEAGDSTGAPAERVDETDAPADGSAESDAGSETGDGTTIEGADEQLVDRVASSDPESIAREIATLRVELEGREGELEGREAELAEREERIDELESKLARARADFQNYKKRTEKRREEERKRATADLVERLLSVHDNLERALDQDEDADIRSGVESTLQGFDEVLAAEGVEAIEPDPGDAVDPHRHEVLVRVESERPEGTVDEIHRVGYEMAGTVVREAQVTVSDGSGADESGAASEEVNDGERADTGSDGEEEDDASSRAGEAETADTDAADDA